MLILKRTNRPLVIALRRRTSRYTLFLPSRVTDRNASPQVSKRRTCSVDSYRPDRTEKLHFKPRRVPKHALNRDLRSRVVKLAPHSGLPYRLQYSREVTRLVPSARRLVLKCSAVLPSLIIVTVRGKARVMFPLKRSKQSLILLVLTKIHRPTAKLAVPERVAVYPAGFREVSTVLKEPLPLIVRPLGTGIAHSPSLVGPVRIKAQR